VLRASVHDRENLLDEFEWHILVKEIAHRIDKNEARRFPPKRNRQGLRLQRKPETVDVLRLTHCLEPERHPFGVAELAAGADLCAAGNRVPRCLGPFNGRAVSHCASLPTIRLSPYFRLLKCRASRIARWSHQVHDRGRIIRQVRDVHGKRLKSFRSEHLLPRQPRMRPHGTVATGSGSLCLALASK
jgi:hypothetical protein